MKKVKRSDDNPKKKRLKQPRTIARTISFGLDKETANLLRDLGRWLRLNRSAIVRKAVRLLWDQERAKRDPRDGEDDHTNTANMGD